MGVSTSFCWPLACLGCASINLHSILLDLFGASVTPSYQPGPTNHDDSRRRNGGMGLWLVLYSWSWIASSSLGCGIGEAVSNYHPPVWGFHVAIGLLPLALVLNALVPDPRNDPSRKPVAETGTASSGSTTPQAGEVMLHRVQKGPSCWGQKVYHGVLLSLEMLRQPGFLVLSLYAGWIYTLVVLTMLSLVSLSSSYSLACDHGGYVVFVMAAGALISVPLHKGNPFPGSRYRAGNSSLVTVKELARSSPTARRVAIIVPLPLCAIAYAMASGSPPTSLSWPMALAESIGFSSCPTVSEYIPLILEAFDMDLTPDAKPQDPIENGPTSAFNPFLGRVAAGLACFHLAAFLSAAVATAVWGMRGLLGQRITMRISAGVLMLLSLLLLLVIIPAKEVCVGRERESGEWGPVKPSCSGSPTNLRGRIPDPTT
ncbi:hypothetical protein VUR80DRAFT_2886 [Thermomyces stellatus]